MPLYDGDMVNLLTPDGRPVSMPGGLAALFPGLQSAAPVAGFAPDIAGGGPPPSPDAPQLAPTLAAPVPQEGPVTDPSQLPAPTGTPAAPQGPVTSPAEDAGPSRPPVPTPPAPPATNQQLAKNWEGRAYQESDRAADEERAGVMASARVQADEATREGARMAQRDAETDRILQERAKQAAANEAELNARIKARDALADQIAKTRIDRSVDHPIWAQIGLILSTIGTAMTRRPGEKWEDPAYNTLMQQIDRKVQGQMQDLDLKRQSLAQMNTGVTEQRQHNMDRLTELDARRDAAIQQAKQAVETIATQMKAPAAIAGAQQLLGKLDQERVKLHAEYGKAAQDQMNTEAARAQAVSMHRETLGMQYRIHRETLEATEREKMATVAAQLLKEGKTEAAAKMKDAAERAMWDPRTGDVQLNPTGQAKFQQADKYEVAARSEQDPQQAAKLRQAASDLRDSARLNDGVLAPDKATAEKVRPQLEAAQGITDRISDAIAKIEAGPSAINREAWAAITTDLGNISGMYQKSIGEKVSTRAFEQTMKHILAFDPDSLLQRAASKDKAVESLKVLKGIVADDAGSVLKGSGIKSGWVPVARGEGDGAIRFDNSEKTAAEVAADRSKGYLDVSRYTGGQEQAKEEAYGAAASRPGAEAGLSPNAVTHLRALAARAATAGDAQHDQIVKSLSNSIADGLKDDSRVSHSLGVIDVLHSADPRLYQEVVAELPELARDRVLKLEAARRPTVNVPRVPSKFDPDAAAAAQAGRDSATTADQERAARVQTGLRDKFGDMGASR